MSTWLQDIERKSPELAAAWKIVGNQDRQCLRNMVRALSTLTLLNTPDDDRRLTAAKYILARKG